MEKWVKSIIISRITFISVCVISFGCNDKSSTSTTIESNQKVTLASVTTEKSIPTIKSDDHVLVFIDKSSSIGAKNEIKFTGDQEKKLIEILKTNGGKLTIYFIHKNLASASHHFEQNFAKPDINGMVEMKAKTNLNKFNKSLDSIEVFINEAISKKAGTGNSNETDMWITVKKINDKFSQKPSSAKLHVVYLSDMIEAVVSYNCGKNYSGIKINTVDMARKLAETDYPMFKKCYNITSLPKNLSIMMYFPTDANPNKDYRNYPEYWKALFAKFGVESVESNI